MAEGDAAAGEQPLQHEQLRWLRRRRGPAPPAPDATADTDDTTAPALGPHPRRVEPREGMSAAELRALQRVIDHQHGASRRIERDLIGLEAPRYRRYSSSALVGVLGLLVLAMLPDDEKFGANRRSVLFARGARDAPARDARDARARLVDPLAAAAVASEDEPAESDEGRRADEGRDEEARARGRPPEPPRSRSPS